LSPKPHVGPTSAYILDPAGPSVLGYRHVDAVTWTEAVVEVYAPVGPKRQARVVTARKFAGLHGEGRPGDARRDAIADGQAQQAVEGVPFIGARRGQCFVEVVQHWVLWHRFGLASFRQVRKVRVSQGSRRCRAIRFCRCCFLLGHLG